MTTLTIFTPTFKRRQTLTRVYESLLTQTSKDFLWMIIDDGSYDGTEELVNTWIKDNKLNIKFYSQENSGKTKSVNRSIRKTKTPLWLCLDSDDWLDTKAVEYIIEEYKKIKNDTSVCGMIGLRFENQDTPMQKKNIPTELLVSTQANIRYKLGIPPEYVQVYKTDIIKEHLYPEIEGENFFPLSYMADQLDQKYSMLVLHNPVMYIEYQEDGITKNNKKHVINNPIGQTIFRHQQFEVAPTLKQKIKAGVAYNSSKILSKKRIPFKNNTDQILATLLSPLGLIDYLNRFKY